MGAEVHGKDARIFLNTWDISGYSNAWTLTVDRDTAEQTVFTDDAKTYLGGDISWTLSVNSFFDTTDAGFSEVVMYDWARTAGDTVYQACLCPEGTTAGTICYEMQGLFTSFPIDCNITNVVAHNFTVQGTANFGRGKVLYKGSISATGTQDGVDFGGATAANTPTFVTYRVLTITGGNGGDIVFATESSEDDAATDAYAAVADYASGTLSDGAISLTRKASTGAIEQWLRLNTTTFDPTSITALITRVTQQGG